MPRKKQDADALGEPAVIYGRYSSHAQRDVSIDQQLKECHAFAARLGLNIVGVYTDRAMTGTNDRRPEFQRMISDAEKGAFSYVIVYTLDRFARDRYDSAVYKRQLKNNGIRVLSAMENIGDDPTGVLMESLLEGLAEYYSKELSRKIRRGMDDNAEKCLANGSLPFGYRRGKDGRYVIEESEAAVVQEIFTRISRGDTFVKIQQDLNARGVRTKSGHEWNKSSFNSMMKNERYTGVYIYGDVRIEGGVPPIIDKELFEIVQYKLKTKSNPRGNPQKRRRENSVYLLTGKLFCGKCKTPMVGISGKSNAPRLHKYYICQKRRTEKACDKSTVRQEWAEREIAAALRDIVLQDEVIDWLAESTIAYQAQHRETAEISALKSQLSDIRKTIKNVMTAIEQGIITNTTKDRLVELETEESKLLARLAMARDDALLNITKEDIVAWLETFRDGDIEDKEYQELILDTFLVAAYLYDNHFRIVFNYTGKRKEIDVPFDVDMVEKESECSCRVRISSPPLHHVAASVISLAATFFSSK